MKETKEMKDLKERAIAIKKSITVYWPRANQREKIILEISPDLEKSYETFNGITAFISDGIYYVIPYMKKVIKILIENDFKRKNIYVPIPNGSYPLDEKERWDELWREKRNQDQIDLILDCEKISKDKGFKEIDECLLKSCLLMPEEGIEVSQTYFRTTYYPAITSSLNCETVKKIGTYCIHKGVIVFIYRNGMTYVTRNFEVLKALKDAGYKEGGLFVPFSNGEIIENAYYAELWKKMF